ncbi:GlxA family transcriptional regulator [Nitrincola nitratireducens]|uniref:L-rhamnose operon regulatory protein rhaS n=1 Tax=Nitrincola nitratireducens TaxID=1229521 RepID=W9V5T1_9GAMM|nr:GlxA family transcriptional regulator [Nitrincola nitratireducens]EXJ11462.1 L-rhamnose operon regulatory protein rhaS [Nitrincola nitratireducens]
MSSDLSYSRARPSTNTSVKHIGFLLLDNFTLISLASAIEPLRMANQLSGKELYQWYTLSLGGRVVQASDGLSVTPDASTHEALPLDMVIVCGGIAPQRSASKEHLQWLQLQARQHRQLGAICTGSWVLAMAGLLDHYEASIHWECIASMHEAYPRVELSSRLFSIDRDRLTSSGGTAPLDMMLTLIARDHGKDLSAGISDMFIYDRVRGEQDQQRVPLKHVLGSNQPKLLEIVALMESNLEELLTLDELASYVDLSRRQLERLFQKYLDCSPSRYYLKLRLIRARQLLKQSGLSIIEVASACGFASTPHFSKCYREYFGIPPREERQGMHSKAAVSEEVSLAPKMTLTLPSMPNEGIKDRVSSAIKALAQARDEPTFASIALH